MINKNKCILFLLFLLIIAIPVSFASDNSTSEVIGENIEVANDTLTVSNDDEILGAGDVYFDASAKSGGDGSQSRPYNTVSNNLGTTNHFAPGTYRISSSISSYYFYNGISFIGSNRDTTILQYVGSDTFIKTTYSIAFTGITLKGASIQTSGGILTATDTIFDSGVAVEETEDDNYKYGNSYGGAIKQMASTSFDIGSIIGGGSSSSQTMTFTNCIFRNNHAAYGGALYSEKGTITITDSLFENNYAENGGGAISALNGAKLTVNNCEFVNDYSSYDAGGAIYLFNVSSASIQNTRFNNCNAAIGGAVASLISPVTVTGSNFNSNKANWIGGAIFSMYGSLTSKSSNFYENSAYHGGAIYADNLTNFEVNGGTFSKNNANGSAGAIFAFTNKVNKITNPIYMSNIANEYNDLYQTDRISLNIGSDDYELIQYKSSYSGSLPYKYDLRTTGGVTPVKDQGRSGNCWAFATMATLESAILKATGKTVILSEGNLKNLANMYSDIGWRYETNNGGMYPFVFGYLTSWAGPVLASLDPTDDWDVIAPIINSAVHVQNILFLQRTSFTDNNAIKKAIMDYGAVCSEIYWSSSYLNGNNYYYNGDSARNHAISVVGWDDTKSISGAPGVGAWIIKNSYGSHRGEGGYYYVSYYDKSLFRVYDESYNSFAVVFNDTIKFNKNYQYDAAFTDYFLTPSYNKVIWYKNTFTSTGNDILSAFSTYFRKVTNWQAEIFVNDELKLTQKGKANPGYWTINLNEEIPLKLGDKFTISLKIECTSTADIPISEYGAAYTMVKEYFQPGVSFFSLDGVTWTDFYGYKATFGSGESGHNYYNQVACIKAFTKEGPKEFLNTSCEILSFNSTNVVVSIKDQRNGNINTGEVEIIIDGVKQKISVSNSKAVLNTYLKKGSHTIKVNYLKNQFYNASSITQTITLPKENPIITITANNIQYGDDLEVKITLTNAIDQLISLPFNVEVNGINYNRNEFSISNLAPDEYTIKVQTTSTDDFNAVSLTKYVTVSKATPSIGLQISDVDIDEKITIKATLSNNITGTVNVVINHETHSINVINGEGSIVIDNNLDAMQYNAVATFVEDNYYSKVTCQKTFNVKKITPKLTILDDDIVEGETALIKVYLPNDIADEIVLIINSQRIRSKASNGEVNFTVNGLILGKYDYSVSFEGNRKYNGATIYDSIEVLEKAKQQSNLTVTDSLNGNSLLINVQLPIDVTGSVTLNFNSIIFTKTPVNGKTSFKINNLENNRYDYTVIFEGDVNYKSGEIKKSVTVNGKSDSKLTVNSIINDKTVVINVGMDSEIEGNVYLTFNHNDLSKQIVNGKAVFEIDNLEDGVYEYTVYFNENEKFKSASVKGFLTIGTNSQVKSSIKAENMVRAYLSGNDFEATFTDQSGNPLVNKEVTFIVNGNEYVALTDSYGVGKVKNNFAPGIYSVLVENPATGENITKTMTIVKRIVENKNILFDYTYSSTFKVKVYGDNGNPVGVGEIVKFRINNKVYSAKTDGKGYARLFIKDLTPKTYSITTEYRGVSVFNTIIVKQILKAKNKSFKRSKVKKYSATLKTSSGKAIKGKVIKFKIKGKTYNAKTNNKGTATIKIKNLTKIGKYKIIISYLKTSIKKTIKIK